MFVLNVKDGSQAVPADGPCFAFDVKTNQQTAILALTAGEGAGIWMAGQGEVADANGSLYALTGNGDFDGTAQFGESFVKMKYTPPAGGNPASLKVVDHWTPWSDLVRTGQKPAPAMKMAGISAPSETELMPIQPSWRVRFPTATPTRTSSTAAC